MSDAEKCESPGCDCEATRVLSGSHGPMNFCPPHAARGLLIYMLSGERGATSSLIREAST